MTALDSIVTLMMIVLAFFWLIILLKTKAYVAAGIFVVACIVASYGYTYVIQEDHKIRTTANEDKISVVFNAKNSECIVNRKFETIYSYKKAKVEKGYKWIMVHIKMVNKGYDSFIYCPNDVFKLITPDGEEITQDAKALGKEALNAKTLIKKGVSRFDVLFKVKENDNQFTLRLYNKTSGETDGEDPDLLLVYDDASTPMETIKLKSKGGK